MHRQILMAWTSNVGRYHRDGGQKWTVAVGEVWTVCCQFGFGWQVGCQEWVAWIHTRKGIICVEKVDLFPAISINVTSCHTNCIALAIPQCIVRGATLIHRKVHQTTPQFVILQHQIGTVVPGDQKIWCGVFQGTIPAYPVFSRATFWGL